MTRLPLNAPDGGDATGEAVFGLTGADTIYLDLDINRLDQPGDDHQCGIDLGHESARDQRRQQSDQRQHRVASTHARAVVEQAEAMARCELPQRTVARLDDCCDARAERIKTTLDEANTLREETSRRAKARRSRPVVSRTNQSFELAFRKPSSFSTSMRASMRSMAGRKSWRLMPFS